MTIFSNLVTYLDPHEFLLQFDSVNVKNNHNEMNENIPVLRRC